LSKERSGLGAARGQKRFAAVKAEGRHLALPLARYAELNGFGERNRERLELLVRVLASSRYVRQRGPRYRLTPLARKSLLQASPSGLSGYVQFN